MPGWRERAAFVERTGSLSVYHYDPSSQVLSKLERRHAKDLADAASMVEAGLVDPFRLLQLYEGIEPELYRFPAIDPPSFRRAVEGFVSDRRDGSRSRRRHHPAPGTRSPTALLARAWGRRE